VKISQLTDVLHRNLQKHLCCNKRSEYADPPGARTFPASSRAATRTSYSLTKGTEWTGLRQVFRPACSVAASSRGSRWPVPARIPRLAAPVHAARRARSCRRRVVLLSGAPARPARLSGRTLMLAGAEPAEQGILAYPSGPRPVGPSRNGRPAW